MSIQPSTSSLRQEEKKRTEESKQFKQGSLPEWDEKSIFPQSIYLEKVALELKSQQEFLRSNSSEIEPKNAIALSTDGSHFFILPKKEAYQLMKTTRAADLGRGLLQNNQSDPTKPSLGLSNEEITFLQTLIDKNPVSRSRHLLDIVLVKLLEELKSIDSTFKTYMRKQERLEGKVNESDGDLNKEIDNDISRIFWHLSCAFLDYIEYKNSTYEHERTVKSKLEYMKKMHFFERTGRLNKNINQALN